MTDLGAYVPRTEENLKQIAKDIANDLIFTDRHIPKEQRKTMLPMVFMPLVFADEATINQMKQNKIDTLFEYYSKANPRGINGFPTFYSFQMLDDAETKKVWEYRNKMKVTFDE